MSMLNFVQELGGNLRRSVDLETGEIIFVGQDSEAKVAAEGCSSGKPSRLVAPLSTYHNSPQMEYYKGASLLTVKRKPRKKQEKQEKQEEVEEEEKEKPKRGKVAGFSWRSRIRMSRTIAKILDVAIPSFVTLTFPKDYPTIERAKRDLDTFIKRLARKFSSVAGVWKLEPQKRGAPHFHLLVWGVSYSELLLFVPVAWYEVVGSGDPNHLAWHKGELGNEPCVTIIESLSHARAYASKYMSKEVNLTCADWGRWWGVFFRARLPIGEKIENNLSQSRAIEIIRYMRKYLEHVTRRKIRRDFHSLTMICNADFWVARLL